MIKFDDMPEFTQWAFITAISHDKNIDDQFQHGSDFNICLTANGIELDVEHVFQRMYENMLTKVDERAREMATEIHPSVGDVMNKLYHIQSELNNALTSVDNAITETYN